MTINLEQVGRIARLAHIEISPAEAAQTSEMLNGILAVIEQLQSVDTANVEPMAHAQDVAQRLREDSVSETDQRVRFQSVAPET